VSKGKAECLFYSREELRDGTVIELRLWQVPEPVPPSEHRFKYALFYGRPGERLVLFDNERGKGDHYHILEVGLGLTRFRGHPEAFARGAPDAQNACSVYA